MAFFRMVININEDKKLMPMDAESRRLIDWMEKDVYDALQKKYLRALMFYICQTIERPKIEEYFCKFQDNADSQEFLLIQHSFSGVMIQLMRTLDKMLEEHAILLKLLYDNDVTV
ncbi:hypothetical protein LXL04_019617 [Taraxacum kok-saghyz]